MKMQRGTVTAIDRANSRVLATLDGGPQIVASYFSRRGRMPWPLARAWFDNSPAWRCLGPIGARRRIFHDDFLHVSSPNGDTPWTLKSSSGSPPAISQGGLGTGSALLTGPNAGVVSEDSHLEKDASCCSPPTAPAGLWLSGSGAPHTGGSFLVGWHVQSDVTTGQLLQVELGGFLTLNASNSTTSSLAVTNPAKSGTDVFNIVDLVWVAGAFAAAWVDGDGPYIITSSTAIPTVALSPGLGLIAGALTSPTFNLDWAHMELVNPVVDPSVLKARAA